MFLSVPAGGVSKDGGGGKVVCVVATPGGGGGEQRPLEVSYTDTKVIGNGSFGVVYQARLVHSGEMVAIKKVLQDKRFKVGVSIGDGQNRIGNGLVLRLFFSI